MVEKDFAQYKGDNLLPEPLDPQYALDVLCDFFLGRDWYISDPLPQKQVNVYIVDAILKLYPFKYKRYIKQKGWEWK